MARITLDGIGHAYGVGKPKDDTGYALKPLHHVWEAGKAYALLGPSGCGKTTLLNVISGLVIPSEGRLLFDERDVTRLPTEQRNIAQVFQFPVIYDTMTVAENLAFPLKNRGMPRAGIDARVAEIAAMLDLTPDLGRRARGLTADAKQKISLGRGLVRSDVSAVLFDEPLTVIDPALKWELRSKLKAVHRALDLLMIYVTHDQVEALTFADKVVVMNDGRAVQIGTPAELFETPEHTFVGYFIGSPGMNLLDGKVHGTRMRSATTRSRSAPPTPASRTAAPPNSASAPITRRSRPRDPSSPACPCRFAASTTSAASAWPMSASAARISWRPIPQACRVEGSEARIRLDPDRIHIYVDDRRVPGESIARGRVASPGRRESLMIDTRIWDNRAWLFVLPVLFFVLFSSLLPMMTVVNYSFQDSMGQNNFFWNGVGWFQNLLDPTTEVGQRFQGALLRNLVFSALVLAIEVPLGIGVSLCIPKSGWKVGATLVVIALPLLIPYNVVGVIWQLFSRTDIGLLGVGLNALGIPFNVTQSAGSAWFVIVVMDVWHWTSMLALLCYAGLKAIPDAYYQAARIDGANRWSVFRNIELPKLRKVLVIGMLLRFMGSFMIYTEPFTVTGGGPGEATSFLSIDLVKMALGQVDLGNAAAYSLVYNLITLTVCWVFFTYTTHADQRKDA